MNGKNLLVVDADRRNLRVLEQKLRNAGFEVHTAVSADSAFETAANVRPDIVLTEVDLPGVKGFELCKRLRNDERTAGTGIIFLSRDTSMKAKQDALDVGGDDYVTKPIFVREIILRVQGLLDKQRRRETPSSFSGALTKLSVVDLLQLMEASGKTCLVKIYTDPAKSGGFATPEASEGTIFFQAGRAVDAYVGRLSGHRAVWRMLMWKDGSFEIEFVPFERSDVMQVSTQWLLLEGMRIIDEWNAQSARLNPLTRLRLGALTAQPIAEEVKPLLVFLDGRRSLVEALDEAGVDDEAAVLQHVVGLVRTGGLVDVGPSTIPEESLRAKSPTAAARSRPAEPPSREREPTPPPELPPVAPPAGSSSTAQVPSSVDDWWQNLIKMV